MYGCTRIKEDRKTGDWFTEEKPEGDRWDKIIVGGFGRKKGR